MPETYRTEGQSCNTRLAYCPSVSQARIKHLLSFLVLFFSITHCSTSLALVILPTTEQYVRMADVVVVATPLKLETLRVSDRVAYELGIFELNRLLVSSQPGAMRYIGQDDALPRFCVLRQYESRAEVFKKQDLTIGKPYILILKGLGMDEECYAPRYPFMPILEATDTNLKIIRKAIFGTEDEFFPKEGMQLPDAVKHGSAVMDQIYRNIEELAKLGNRAVDEYTYLDCPSQAQSENYLFRQLQKDNRVLAASVSIRWNPRKGSTRSNGVHTEAYSPIIFDCSHTNPCCLRQGEGSSPPQTVGQSEFSTGPACVDPFYFEKILKCIREVDMPLGRVTIRVFLKIEPGIVGEQFNAKPSFPAIQPPADNTPPRTDDSKDKSTSIHLTLGAENA